MHAVQANRSHLSRRGADSRHQGTQHRARARSPAPVMRPDTRDARSSCGLEASGLGGSQAYVSITGYRYIPTVRDAIVSYLSDRTPTEAESKKWSLDQTFLARFTSPPRGRLLAAAGRGGVKWAACHLDCCVRGVLMFGCGVRTAVYCCCCCKT